MAGFFLTFEGGEGGGKTTQASLLAEALRERGHTVLVTHEPGGTAVGKVLRRLVLEPDGLRLAAEAEVLLLLADRAQHIHEVILPGLCTNTVVISDRFVDSTLAYQGYGRGIPLDLLSRLNSFVCRACMPALTFLLDVSVTVGLQRASQYRETAQADIFEAQTPDFHHRVRAGFLAVAREHPQRVCVIDADRSVDCIHHQIVPIVLERMGQAAHITRQT